MNLDDAPEVNGGEKFDGFLEGYILNLYRQPFDYFFRLHEPSPKLKCRWIWPNLPNVPVPPEAVSLLLDAFRAGHPVRLTIGPPMSEFQGEPVCPVYALQVTYQV